MKNRIQILLAAAIAFSLSPLVMAENCGTTGCETSCPTNKTHLTPRSHGVNLALEKTAGWPNLMNRKDQEDAIGGNIQAVFFMMGSTDEEAIAKYFLFPSTATPNATVSGTASNCNTSCGSGDCKSVKFERKATAVAATGSPFNNTFITTGDFPARGAGSVSDRDLGFFLHNWNTGATGAGTGGNAGKDFTGTSATATGGGTFLQLCPEHEAIGVTFNWHQDLKCLFKGLYFELAVPVVNVENTLGMTTSGDEATELKKFLMGTRAGIPAGTTIATSSVVGNENAYKNLTRAKMNACDLDETGVADVDLILGYRFLNKAKYHVAVNLGVTIPTGNTPDAEWVFDAIVGNGGHVGFGAGLDARAQVWESSCCDHSLFLNFAMNYRYLFKDDECRTLGICGENFGQYMLLIDRTKSPHTQQLTPAANVTTLRVDVTPGSQFDGILSLNYNWCGFALDLGYNLFYREREKVSVGCSSTCGTTTPQFPENTWAIATRNARMTDQIADADLPMGKLGDTNEAPDHIYKYVNQADLDRSAAETPSLTTHKLFAGLGYWTKGWEVPVLVGIGGHFEWADHDLITNWGFNARLGVAF